MVASKKRKQQKAEDFKKAKLKVGAKKLAPSNVTQIDLKSKSIYVPTQSVARQQPELDDSNSTNKRRYHIPDLLSQLKHYSSSNRRDACNALKDVAKEGGESLLSQLGLVMDATVRLILDDSSEVRQALMAFYRVLLSNLTQSQVRPFLSLVMVFITSATTHLYDDIRLDGLRMLDIWISFAPNVTREHGAQLLPSYVRLLSNQAGGTVLSSDAKSAVLGAPVTPSGKRGSAEASLQRSRSVVLTSLQTFLRAAFGASNEDSFWFMKETVSSKHESNQSLLKRPLSEFFQNDDKLGLFLSQNVASNNNLSSNSLLRTSQRESFTAVQSDELDQSTVLLPFVTSMTRILIDCWIESAPLLAKDRFSSQDVEELQLLSLIVECLLLMWRHLLAVLCVTPDPAVVEETLRMLSRHLNIYFPFSGDQAIKRESKVELTLITMSAQYAELLSHFIRLIPLPISSDNVLDPKHWLTHVLGFLKSTYSINAQSPREVMKSDVLLLTFCALWNILYFTPAVVHEPVLYACVQFHLQCHPMSSTKRLSMLWLSRLVQAQQSPLYSGHWRLLKMDNVSCGMDQWIASLPKYIWQLRLHSPETSLEALKSLHGLVRSVCQLPSMQPTLMQLQNTFHTLFCVHLQGRDVYGPFVDLPVEAQNLACDIWMYLPELDIEKLTAVVSCCLVSTVSVAVLSRFIDILEARQHPKLYHVLLTLLMGVRQRELDRLVLTETHCIGGAKLVDQSSWSAALASAKLNRRIVLNNCHQQSVAFVVRKVMQNRHVLPSFKAFLEQCQNKVIPVSASFGILSLVHACKMEPEPWLVELCLTHLCATCSSNMEWASFLLEMIFSSISWQRAVLALWQQNVVICSVLIPIIASHSLYRDAAIADTKLWLEHWQKVLESDTLSSEKEALLKQEKHLLETALTYQK